YCADKMADVNALFGQTPIMAPPVRADDQILPHIRAFTASSNLPSIYIKQFWDTILYDKKAGCYKCQLDEQWFDLTKETLREALQITPVNRNQAFAVPPSIDGLIDFVNQLGYLKLVMNLSPIVTNDLFQPFYKALSQELILIIPRGSGRNLPNPYILLLKTNRICLGIHQGKKGHSDCDSKHSVHQADYPPSSEEAQVPPKTRTPLHLSNEEPVIGYLKFSAKGTKRKIFRMPIPGRLIMENIREASYYQEYQENVAKHTGFLASESGSTQDLLTPKPAKPARKPQSTVQKNSSKSFNLISGHRKNDKPAKAKRIKRSISRKTRQPRSSLKSMGASEAEEVPAEEPQVEDEDADYQKDMEESMKDAYALPKGPLPPVVIREPESGKYQPLPEVPGKCKAKVTKEQVAHDLLNSEEESEKIMLGVEKGGQDEGQAGPDPGNAKARVQSTSSPMVHAGSNHEHMDLDVANVSPQPSTEQLDEGFTATIVCTRSSAKADSLADTCRDLDPVVDLPALLVAGSNGARANSDSFHSLYLFDLQSDPAKAVQGSAHKWISELAKQADSRSSFNELLDTPIDFSNFIMNRLGVDTLTLELLARPTYELMRGSCNTLTELEYHLEEVYKAMMDQLDWVNPKVTNLKIVEWHNYKHLDWISIRRDDDKIYKFKEGDFKRLRLRDIKDMMLLLVQGKL
nr:E-beta-farnesene synthase [Tanacetum cinerariifolium]